MTQEEKRARIIADQAEREAANPPRVVTKKPRSNWAASPPIAPHRKPGVRPGGPFTPKP